jgi:hypothetical protein
MRWAAVAIILLVITGLARAASAPQAHVPPADLRVLDASHYRIHTDLDRQLTEDLARRMDVMYEEYARRMQSDFLAAESHDGEVIDFHALRHTCGAWAAMGGAHPKAVQALMRHSVITLTMDTYGHLFGNAILSMVGEELRKTIDGHGLAVRWGGDEFLGILTADTAEAQQILARFMDAIKNEDKDDRYNVTVSVGIAELSGKPSIEEAVKRADQALYRSKKDGRNRITVYEEDAANV